MTSSIRFASLSVDCPDAGALADVCARPPGMGVFSASDEFGALLLGDRWPSTEPVQDDRPPSRPDPATPRHLRLDVAVDDLDAAEVTALAAGARRAEVRPSPERWRVMIDPAGHPGRPGSLVPGPPT